MKKGQLTQSEKLDMLCQMLRHLRTSKDYRYRRILKSVQFAYRKEKLHDNKYAKYVDVMWISDSMFHKLSYDCSIRRKLGCYLTIAI